MSPDLKDLTEQAVADTLHEMQQIVRDRKQPYAPRISAGHVIASLASWQVKREALDANRE